MIVSHLYCMIFYCMFMNFEFKGKYQIDKLRENNCLMACISEPYKFYYGDEFRYN